MSDVADGVDCALVAEPDEARPDDELTPRHELSPCWIVTGAVAAVAPVESVRVRVIDVPAAILTVQVNDVSVVGCSSRVARTLQGRARQPCPRRRRGERGVRLTGPRANRRERRALQE